MYLLDTNIFLELILEQEKAEVSRSLIELAIQNQFAVSDFSVHSIGVLLYRKNRHTDFTEFVHDIVQIAGVNLIQLPLSEMNRAEQAARDFRLDFDDAYQYALAETFNLAIVSFDADFDRTERKRVTPEEVLKS